MGKTNHPKIIISIKKPPSLRKKFKSSKKYKNKILTPEKIATIQKLCVKSTLFPKSKKDKFNNLVVEKLGKDNVTVLNHSIIDYDKINGVETMDLMKKGVKCIINPVLISRSEGLFSIGDAVIRSDCLSSVIDFYPDISYYTSIYGWIYIPICLSKLEFLENSIKIKNNEISNYSKVLLYSQNRVLQHYQQCSLQYGILMDINEDNSLEFTQINFDSLIEKQYRLCRR